jgi:hypothetical protein
LVSGAAPVLRAELLVELFQHGDRSWHRQLLSAIVSIESSKYWLLALVSEVSIVASYEGRRTEEEELRAELRIVEAQLRKLKRAGKLPCLFIESSGYWRQRSEV